VYDHSRSNVPIDVSTAVTAVATFVEGFCGYLPSNEWANQSSRQDG